MLGRGGSLNVRAMIKPLTADLAQPLYLELPNQEPTMPDIESDFVSGSESDSYWRLENSLQQSLGEDRRVLYVRG